MRLAISNIAWNLAEDEEVAQLLRHYGVDAIDVAPSKYFPDPFGATNQDIARVKSWWNERGIEITGMQALMFGTTGLNIFGAADVQQKMLAHLKAICRIGARLGAPRLVFGSPKNRDRSGLTDQEALDIAVPFFRRLGDIAQAYGVLICLEPNPPCYGANFMTTSAETAEVVTQVAHASIRLQLDIGALTINREDAASVISTSHHMIGHIHASEPDLLPLGDRGTDHSRVHVLLKQHLPEHLISVEMVATKNEPHVISIDRALKAAVNYYRPVNEAGVNQ